MAMQEWETADSLAPVLQNLSNEFVVPELAFAACGTVERTAIWNEA